MISFYLAFIDDEEEKRDFEYLYHAYYKQMIVLAYSLLQNYFDAEDAVHNAFIKIARNMAIIQKIQDPDDIRNYFLKAAQNAALNMHEWKKLRADLETDFRLAYDIEDNEFLDELCQKMDYERVLKAMQQLERKYRDVLYYHFVMDLSVPDIAQLLERKENTITVQLYRGKKRLLEILNERRNWNGNDR